MGAEVFRFSQPSVSALEARAYFLFDGKKKVAKEKATPGSAPLRGSLRYSSGRAARMNSPSAQTMRADCPRPACVAQRLSRGPKGVSALSAIEKSACCGRPPKRGKDQIHCDTGSAWVGFPGPLRGAEQRRLGRKKGEHCLRGFSPELRSPRPRRVAQGTGAAGTDPGSPSSLLTFFLATQEESKTRVRRGTRR